MKRKKKRRGANEEAEREYRKPGAPKPGLPKTNTTR